MATLEIKGRLTETELAVIRQGLDAIGWGALPKEHPERKAAERMVQLFALADTASIKIQKQVGK